MKRLCLTIACATAVAWTQASAQDLSVQLTKSPRPHAAKAKHPAGSESASLNVIHFSDPYAPPEGTAAVRKTYFPTDPYPTPKEPQAGLSIGMGKDAGGHTTGGLGWKF
jgi:hypothetical protein